VLQSRRRRRALAKGSTLTIAAAALVVLVGAVSASAAGPFTAGNLLVSTSVWTTDANITSGVTQLPPGCGSTAAPCITAQANGTYPQVFNNDGQDGSFGVTQPIVLDQLTTGGALVSQTTVPNSTQSGITPTSDQMVTSFSSKSELALNESTDGNDVTFMGYVAPSGGVDVSNSDTPGAADSTNSDSAPATYRAVAQLDANGNFAFTETNAYSGNNGRAAIEDPQTNTLFMAGNGGNGANPEPQGVVTGTGSQIEATATGAESAQTPPALTPMGNFNVTQLSDPADKSAKDDNFRGLTQSNNVLYYTKGSGSNGVDTVYFLDTTGTACPSGGVGLPSTSASLPVAGSFTSPSYSTSNAALGLTTSNPGLAPTNMCILSGFPTGLAKSATDASMYPFGMWFANPTTLYVADEGAGDNAYSTTTNSYTAAAASTTAGLEKWSFNSSQGKWVLDYTLQNGLNLGTPYSVASSGGNSYPTGTNSYTSGTGSKAKTVSGPWTPATDGLRNLVGQVNNDGTVSIWATTSTVSFSGDQGTDPNALVSITDNLGATTLPSAESFSTVMPPTYGVVVRGVSFTPGTGGQPTTGTPEVPLPLLLPVAALGVGGVAYEVSRRHRRNVAAGAA
jgi:hypothetical protein